MSMLSKPKKLIIYIFSMLIFLSIIYLTFIWATNPKYRNIQLNRFKSTDAKFYSDGYIVTSRNKRLTFVNTVDRSIVQTKISSNWIDCLEDDNIIVYSNEKGKVGLCRFEPDKKMVTENYLIFSDEYTRIDPSITKLNDVYYLTLTKVIGEVNRSDPNAPIGIYTIELYQSTDLRNWGFVSNITTRENNTEDVKLNSFNGTLSVLYEVETLDKQNSQIEYMISNDLGKSWENPVVLIESNADNEPASILYLNKKYYLFYSSDIEEPGMSYSGSDAYLNIYNSTFNLIKQEKLSLSKDSRILLYQALVYQNEATLLYSYDYLNTDDLVVENDVDINK